ncbi:MAG: Ig-like domain-containing protein, partial [Bacteroidales bacterium]|nr:Ig-like domain-containing protein [Bacteroidales bacterium]
MKPNENEQTKANQNMDGWKIKYLCFYSVILSVFFASCAQQATLTGGDQDVSPPLILNQEPPNYTTAFNSPQIRVYFDEYVELVNPNETFLFSPPLKQPPEYTLKGKSLIIDLNNELEKNITYIITCNEGIKDLTEGNFLPVTTFVYSTGDYIDSLSLFGTVMDAYTMTPEGKVGVILYKQQEDSALLKNLPYYYTTTRKDGTFLFSNIAEGEYQLYALTDNNRNYLFDQNDEKVAFSNNLVQSVYIPVPVEQTDSSDTPDSNSISVIDTSFTVDSSGVFFVDTSSIHDSSNISLAVDSSGVFSVDTSSIQDSSKVHIDFSQNILLLFAEQDTTTHFLRREFKGNYRHDFIFKNPITDFKLNQINNMDTVINYLTQYNKTKDTISIFITFFSYNSIEFELYANHQLLDTLTFDPSQSGISRRSSRQSTDTLPHYLTYQELTKGELDKYPAIMFDSPVRLFDSTKCILIEENKNGNDTLNINCSFSDSICRLLTFIYPFKEKTKYTILCPDSVFFAYNGNCNDSIAINFTTKSVKDYGSIQIKYQFYREDNFILQLLSERRNLVQEDFSTYNTTITYNYLQPGKYLVRVIVDENNNKQ